MNIRKDMRGNWAANSVYPIRGNLRLTIRTYKNYSSQLVTMASVGEVKGNVVSHRMYIDFSEALVVSLHPRITAKVVEAQHNKALAMLDGLLERVAAHYKIDTVAV